MACRGVRVCNDGQCLISAPEEEALEKTGGS